MSFSVLDDNSADQRPEIVSGGSTIGQTIGQWINPAALAGYPSGTLGNAPLKEIQVLSFLHCSDNSADPVDDRF